MGVSRQRGRRWWGVAIRSSSGRFLSQCLLSSRVALTAPWLGVLGPALYASLQFFNLGSEGDKSLHTELVGGIKGIFK